MPNSTPLVVNKGSYFASRYEAWSYATCIRATTGDGIIVVNRSQYSKATSTHQKLDAAFWRGKLVVEIQNADYNVGPEDLFKLAHDSLNEMRENMQAVAEMAKGL